MFIVVYDDDTICVPMTFSEECDGAIECGSGAIALFATRAEASTAIRISTKFAELGKAQGKPINDDFLIGLKNVKIRRAKLQGGDA